MARILIFGDSVAYGAWDKRGGWIQRLREFFDEKNFSEMPYSFTQVYSLGVSGDKTTDLLERIEKETKSRIKEGEETIIILAVGTNDAQFLNREVKMRTNKEDFEKNIEDLIRIAKKYSEKIFFVGLFPVDEKEAAPIPWDKNKFYKNENLRKYNEIIKEVCKNRNVNFIEVFENVIKMDYEKLLFDGLHPNSKGHETIFKIVKDFMLSKLEF